MPTPLVAKLSLPAPSGLAATCLRVQQFSSLARWSSLLAACSVTSCLMVVATFWRTASHAYLLTLLAVLLGLHGLAVFGARRGLKGKDAAISSYRLHARTAMVAAIALCWASAPLTLMPIATPDQRQLLIYISSGLMSAGILFAPMLNAALLCVGISALAILLAMSMVERSIAWQHAATIVAYGLAISGLVIVQSREFARRVLNEVTLEEQGELISLLLSDFEENASDFLWETDAGFRLHRISDRLTQVMGCDQASLQGASMLDSLERCMASPGASAHDNAKLVACLQGGMPFRGLQVRLGFGEGERWLSMTGKPMLDEHGALKGYRGVGSDITAVRSSDERISYLARYDSMTNLPNRSLFQEALKKACASPVPFAVLCLDLDGFKLVNDSLGYATGDALLAAVAGRLRSCVRETDVVARLGGDEFAVLQIESDKQSAATLARRLVENITKPFQIAEHAVSVGVSIGIVLPDSPGALLEDLLQGADLALYQSKTTGRGTWNFFDAAMALRAQERQALQIALRHAIDQDELMLEFQPIVDLTSGDIIGAEALVRWLHPTRGRISPADFIPLAEETGLIVALGEWVLRRACKEAAGWSGQARVAVNLSPVQFRDPGLLALIDGILAETGLPGHRLELEITESVFLDAVDTTVSCLEALRLRGVHIALDDFGTGYSSLSYLRSFPFDKVKIDQSFIRDLGVTEEASAIIHAIVGMARSLGMRTTGEGVETASQAKLLQLTGCSQVQGYLFGRPGPPEAICTAMQAEQTPFSTVFSMQKAMTASKQKPVMETAQDLSSKTLQGA